MGAESSGDDPVRLSVGTSSYGPLSAALQLVAGPSWSAHSPLEAQTEPTGALPALEPVIRSLRPAVGYAPRRAAPASGRPAPPPSSPLPAAPARTVARRRPRPSPGR